MIVPFAPAYGNPESRRFQRVALSLSGRYMLPSRVEHPCRTVNISPGGMLVSGPAKPAIGETIVIYVDALGRFSGSAVRIVPDGFAMTLSLSSRKREKLADQLTWFANRKLLGSEDGRRHERFVPLFQRTVVRLPCGKEHLVKIRDLSLSGVAIEMDHAPELGAPIIVGSTHVTVVRLIDGGFAGEFIAPFAEGEINELTRL